MAVSHALGIVLFTLCVVSVYIPQAGRIEDTDLWLRKSIQHSAENLSTDRIKRNSVN